MADDWNSELPRKPMRAARRVNHVLRVNSFRTRDDAHDSRTSRDNPLSVCSFADFNAECQSRLQKVMIEIVTWSLKSLPRTGIVSSKRDEF
jgi:hypothetical protein